MVYVGRDLPSERERVIREVPSSPLDTKEGAALFSEEDVVVARLVI